MLGLPDLVYAAPAFAKTRDDFMQELGEVFDVLGKAFEELRQLRMHVANGAAALTVAKSY